MWTRMYYAKTVLKMLILLIKKWTFFLIYPLKLFHLHSTFSNHIGAHFNHLKPKFLSLCLIHIATGTTSFGWPIIFLWPSRTICTFWNWSVAEFKGYKKEELLNWHSSVLFIKLFILLSHTKLFPFNGASLTVFLRK